MRNHPGNFPRRPAILLQSKNGGGWTKKFFFLGGKLIQDERERETEIGGLFTKILPIYRLIPPSLSPATLVFFSLRSRYNSFQDLLFSPRKIYIVIATCETYNFLPLHKIEVKKGRKESLPPKIPPFSSLLPFSSFSSFSIRLLVFNQKSKGRRRRRRRKRIFSPLSCSKRGFGKGREAKKGGISSSLKAFF